MRTFIPFILICAACGGDDTVDIGETEELITTVELVFTPVVGGAQQIFTANDPDGDGGEAPTIDTVAVVAGAYDVSVAFENRLEDPPEDITAEIRDESDEHQIFFTNATGGGLWAPHAYSDLDANGLPIGLANRVTLDGTETGGFTVTLRHLPAMNGAAQKTAGLADDVDANGVSSIPGGTDAAVTFPVAVAVP